MRIDSGLYKWHAVPATQRGPSTSGMTRSTNTQSKSITHKLPPVWVEATVDAAAAAMTWLLLVLLVLPRAVVVVVLAVARDAAAAAAAAGRVGARSFCGWRR